MAQAVLSVRLPEYDKKDFEFFCESVGMTASTAVNLFVKAVLREQKIPFELKSDDFYNKENMRVLKASIAQLNEGKATEHDIIEV